MSEQDLRVAVVGAGHFGREHARVYSSLPGVKLEAVCDTNEVRGCEIARKLNVPFVSNFLELAGRVDAASLAVPTVDHHRIACQLLAAGIGVLVEKPMSRTVEEADEMIRQAESTKSVLQVGHLERFNPAVTAAAGIARRPLFFEVHRLSVFTPRSLDIDVVMDLMIHDIDIVLSLVSSPVTEIRAAGIPVITPHNDIANARIEFSSGCVANLTASRVSADRVRKLRFFQPGEYVSVDYYLQEAATVRVKAGPVGKPPEFRSELLPVKKEEPLVLEIRSFLSAVRGEQVEVTGRQARKALEVAISINNEIRTHSTRTGLNPPA
jgi:predicted dehydrogenase